MFEFTARIDESYRIVEFDLDDGNWSLYKAQDGDDSPLVVFHGDEVVARLTPDDIGGLIAAFRFVRPGGTNKPAQPVPEARKSKSSPENHGAPWTSDDEESFAEQFELGASLQELMAFFGRSRGGITSRMVAMGLAGSNKEAMAILRQQLGLPPTKEEDDGVALDWETPERIPDSDDHDGLPTDDDDIPF